MIAAAQPRFPVANKGMITVMVMMATIMEVLDITIANVAIPHMQGTLSATQDQISWVLTSYVVASAIMMLPTGWLSGRFGRKRIFLIAIAGFTVASALCGIASSLDEMVFFRLLQGAFGAALVPISQAILLDINPREKHGAAMAVWGIGIMVAPILGPTLGGYITEYYDWRWIFFINLPVGILCFIGVSALLTETEPHDRPFDIFGFLTLGLAIGAIQLMFDRGLQADWFASKEIIFYAGFAAGMLWMFLVHARYTVHPFLSAEMFRDRNFVMALVFIFFVGIILLATIALLPPFMQTLMGYSVLDAGVLMAPRGVGALLGMVIVGITSGKVDPRPLIFLGLLLTAVSLWDTAQFSSFVPPGRIIRTGVVQGIGLGLIFVPLSTIAFATLDTGYRTEAAGLFSLVRNIGSSLGISIVTSLLGLSIQTNHSYLGENITPFNTGVAAQFMPQAAGGSTAALHVLDAEINRQAATIGYINNFSMMMWIVILVMPMVFLLRHPDRKKDEELPAMMAE